MGLLGINTKTKGSLFICTVFISIKYRNLQNLGNCYNLKSGIETSRTFLKLFI